MTCCFDFFKLATNNFSINIVLISTLRPCPCNFYTHYIVVRFTRIINK
ncbi:MAG: hypothetical protein EGQ04_06945 [Ruminococcaceae bacterium]|nr:hypothetical protein [Oscillospiraceae bacterium]